MNQYNKEENSERLEKSKAEITEEMGYTRHEVSDYQRMAQTVEVVRNLTRLMGGNFTFTELENLPPRKQRQTFRSFLRSILALNLDCREGERATRDKDRHLSEI